MKAKRKRTAAERVVENKDAHGPRWCPGRPPSIATRRKCTGCVHDEHRGMCTGRNGGTAYPCPCIRTSVPEDAT